MQRHKNSKYCMQPRRSIYFRKMTSHTNGDKMHIMKHMSIENWNELPKIWGIQSWIVYLNTIDIKYIGTTPLKDWGPLKQWIAKCEYQFDFLVLACILFHIVKDCFQITTYAPLYTTTLKMIRVFVTIFVHSAFFLKRIFEFMLQL